MVWAFTLTAVALLITDWDTSAPFCEYFAFTPGAHATSRLSGFLAPRCVPLSLTVYTEDIANLKSSGAIEFDNYHLRPSAEGRILVTQETAIHGDPQIPPEQSLNKVEEPLRKLPGDENGQPRYHQNNDCSNHVEKQGNPMRYADI